LEEQATKVAMLEEERAGAVMRGYTEEALRSRNIAGNFIS